MAQPAQRHAQSYRGRRLALTQRCGIDRGDQDVATKRSLFDSFGKGERNFCFVPPEWNEVVGMNTQCLRDFENMFVIDRTGYLEISHAWSPAEIEVTNKDGNYTTDRSHSCGKNGPQREPVLADSELECGGKRGNDNRRGQTLSASVEAEETGHLIQNELGRIEGLTVFLDHVMQMRTSRQAGAPN